MKVSAKREKWIVLITLVLCCCVKDPQEYISKPIFTLSIGGIDFSKNLIYADGQRRYTVDISVVDGVALDDGKVVTVSVTDGNVLATNSLGTISTQANVTMQGRQGTFYYIPPLKAQEYASLSIAIGGIVQIFNFSIKPSEPTEIILAMSPASPTTADLINVTAYLLTENSQVSNDLKVFFEAEGATKADSIITAEIPPPFYAISVFDPGKKIVSAGTTVAIRNKPGRIRVIAKYTNSAKEVVRDTIFAEITK